MVQQQRIHLQCRSHRKCGFNPWVGKIPWRGAHNPLQYSCLENPMNRGTWRAAKSWTRLKRFSTCTPERSRSLGFGRKNQLRRDTKKLGHPPHTLPSYPVAQIDRPLTLTRNWDEMNTNGAGVGGSTTKSSCWHSASTEQIIKKPGHTGERGEKSGKKIRPSDEKATALAR